MNEKKLVEKSLEDSLVTVTVQLYQPFYNFMKEYLAFFGSKQSIEELSRTMIYQSVQTLYRKLEAFAKDPEKHLEESVCFNKWPHIALTSFQDDEEDP